MKRLAVALGVGLLVLGRCALAQSPPGLKAQLATGSVQLTITGAVGSACTVQWIDGLSSTSHWQFLTNLTPLQSSPFRIFDSIALTAPRFYRAFSQQVPTNVVPGTNMVWMTPGTFIMGSRTNEAERGFGCLQRQRSWVPHRPSAKMK